MADLQPGEKVVQVWRSSDTAILRSVGIATALVTALLLFIARDAEGGFDTRRFLISIAIFAAIMLASGFLLDRNREWVMTDRRVIAPNGRSLDLGPDLKVRPLIFALRLRQQGRLSLTVRGVPDIGGMAATIRQAALTPRRPG
ncbi:hypothetical protein [Paracoccus zhejiangensis]|uniref:DUF304 domain-containing protein n=1 Tax=Paracoccus zhejiangensis TaxID=1077935 RepID=A0A2H5EY39_9RHOB|nr:hypothetical protein [Paracoccus zhejiangensis]AUH64183.1 hypothetical protein CX676_08470 [Paracoccus zhejiangensis]